MELCSSVECKGIIGNDGRHYILDLLRTFPPDLNFLMVDGEELPAESQRQGFPRQHRHRLACLRQELIEAFVEHRCAGAPCRSIPVLFTLICSIKNVDSASLRRYLLFMKMAALQLMQQKANKDSKTEAPAIADAPGTDAETVQTQSSAAEDAEGSADRSDSSASVAAQTQTDRGENQTKPATNGPVELTAAQNGECKSPLAGKELEESIPGLAQAKELAETLVAEDGSCIGMSKMSPKPHSRDSAGRATLVGNYESNVLSVTKMWFYWHS